jgi:hypothetical protein
MATQTFLSIVAGVKKLITAAQLGGTTYAGQIPALNATTGLLDITMMPSGIGPNTENIVASEAIAAGALVNVYTNAGAVSVRNADNSNTSKIANGFVLAAVASAGTATVYFGGIISGLSGLTPGAQYFLGTVGAPILASALPTTAGTIIQSVGVAFSASVLVFEMGDPVTQ